MALSRLSERFWNHELWLPKGVSWEDLDGNDPDVIYPKPSDLYACLIAGLVLLVLRYFFETLIVQPIAKHIGVRDVTYKAQPNPTLEAAFLKQGKTPFTHKEVTGLAKQVDWTEIKVQRWLRKRRLQNAPTNLKKFRECAYQLVFYASSFIGGLIFMWDKSWLWEPKKCWENWPNHSVTAGAYWYYIIEMGFYLSLLFTCLLDSKRKDFYEMTMHHLITLGLMAFSWSINFVRIGTLVLLVHDVADPWMQLAKMLKYAHLQSLCEVVFTIFIVLWLLTRVFYYPFWVLYTCLVDLPAYMVVPPVIMTFQGFMVALQLLHIMWTYYVLRVALQRFTHGELTHDTRSDSESLTESEDEGAGDAKPSSFPNNVKNQNNCSKDGK